MEMNKLYSTVEKKEVNDTERSIVAWGSRPVQDRDGEVIKSDAWDLKNFQQNPVLMFAHSYATAPVGKVLWTKVTPDGLRFKAQFAKTQMGEELYTLYRDGFMSAFSVGFVGRKYEEPDEVKSGEPRRYWTDVELLEISCVAIPSCPAALMDAYESGHIKTKDLSNALAEIKKLRMSEVQDVEIQTEEKTVAEEVEVEPGADSDGGQVEQEEKEVVTKPDTENYVHIAAPNQEGKHSDHKIRTITISDKRGIKAHYCIPCKTITGYMFESSKWSHEDAQAWVDDHSKGFDELLTKSESFVCPDCGEEHEDEKACGKPKPKKEASTCPKCGKEIPDDEDECPNCAPSKAADNEVCLDGSQAEADEKACDGDHPLATDEELDIVIEESDQKSEVSIEIEVEDLTTKSVTVPSFEVKSPFHVDVKLQEEGHIERWNKSLSKLFDIAAVPSKPSQRSMKLYCDFLECKVKNIYQNEFLIPSPLLGAYLSAFKACAKTWDLKDVRNFGWGEDEYPPSYETIRINSKIEDDFLVSGVSFYSKDGIPVIIGYYPSYYGLTVSVGTSRKNMAVAKQYMSDVHKYIETDNPMRNEKFALNGEFISLDPHDTWDQLILTDDVEKSVRYAETIINKKKDGFNGRGMLFMGKPGVGKTKAARILMTQTEHTFIWVSPKDLARSYHPASSINLGFKMARQLAPSVILFEDIDGWITNELIDIFKTELDGLKKNKGVITILTTNNPEKFPDVLIDRPGRFHDILDFKMPDAELRQKMIESWAGEVSIDTLKFLLESTDGYSGAHMWELIEFAKDIVEDANLPMEDALKMSLEKLIGQKELIQQIRSGSKSLVVDEEGLQLLKKHEGQFVTNDFDVESLKEYTTTLVKAGRRLSNASISTLREAMTLIEQLIGENQQEIEIEVDDSINLDFEPEVQKTIDLDPEEVKSTLKDIVKEFLSEKPDIKALVDERIRKAQGKIF